MDSTIRENYYALYLAIVEKLTVAEAFKKMNEKKESRRRKPREKQPDDIQLSLFPVMPA